MMGAPDRPDYRDEPLGGVLDAIAADTPAPGGGAAAALTVAMAAALAAMVARRSRRTIPEAATLAAQADRVRSRVEPLAGSDATAYGRLLDVLRSARGAEVAGDAVDPTRSEVVRAAFEAATDVPLEVAGLGAEVVALAARLAAEGNPNLRGDAATGAFLAEAATRAAATLVELNVDHGGLPAERAERARAHVLQAARSCAGVRHPEHQP